MDLAAGLSLQTPGLDDSSYWGALGAVLSQNLSGSRLASHLSTCLPRF